MFSPGLFSRSSIELTAVKEVVYKKQVEKGSPFL